ncbi:MAG: SigE family RNA polymerase sigma factor [Candidatus Nanopelagicales bacterium]
MARDEEFTQFVVARGTSLRRTAYLMTGQWADAEDLTQTALSRLYLAWPRVRLEGAEAYARTILTRSFVDSRRRFWHREQPAAELPEQVGPADLTDERLDLGRALALLPRSYRAVLVLRFWDDMTVQEVADVLQVSPGTVKSRTSWALDAMRAAMGTDAVLIEAEAQS